MPPAPTYFSWLLCTISHLHSRAGSVLNSRPWVTRGRVCTGRTNPRGWAGSGGAIAAAPGCSLPARPAQESAAAGRAPTGGCRSLPLSSPGSPHVPGERPLAPPLSSALPRLRSAPRQVLPHPSEGLPAAGPAPAAGRTPRGGWRPRPAARGSFPAVEGRRAPRRRPGTGPSGARCTYSRFSCGCSCRCMAREKPKRLSFSPLQLITLSVSRLKAPASPGRTGR